MRLICCLQSLGWEHYEVHEPEPHILLFKYVCPSKMQIAPHRGRKVGMGSASS